MGIKDVIKNFGIFQARVAGELRAQRKRAGISLKEMAERLGLHQNTLGKCERGEFGIGLDIIYGYANILDRPITTFIGRSEWRETEGNPIAGLSEDELLIYSQLVQGIFNVFAEEGI